MEQFQRILDITLISISNYQLTLGQLILIPTIALSGYLLLGWVISRLTKILTSREVSPDIIQIVRRASYILGLVVLLITMLDLVNVPLTAFAFVSGAVAIGVGFGAQNIINNFISGWILMWERPIGINDFIEIGNASGTVEQIGTRSTRVRRVDGVHMLIPNSKLLEETVVNWTLVDTLLRNIVRVGVSYGSDVQKVNELLLEIAKQNSSTLSDPEPFVIFDDFGDSALMFDTYFWVRSAGDKGGRAVRSEMRFEIDRIFAENDIVIAFPQRDIHLDGTLKLER
ncbi:MAG: small-conductance mechanosensitive channel [Candidatus Azotimanducaceae bacterium]|jgi:small-conductance mechanosensitive channel